MKVSGCITSLIANGYERTFVVESETLRLCFTYLQVDEYLAEPMQMSQRFAVGDDVFASLALRLVQRFELVIDSDEPSAIKQGGLKSEAQHQLLKRLD